MNDKPIRLKEACVITSAGYGPNRSIRFDAGVMGECDLWVYSNEHGIAAIVGVPDYVNHNGHFEHAYEQVVDLLPEVDFCDLYEAYGFEDAESFAKYQGDIAAGIGDYRDLADGYRSNSCAQKTGIVWVGYNEDLRPLTTDLLRHHEITLTIVRED